MYSFLLSRGDATELAPPGAALGWTSGSKAGTKICPYMQGFFFNINVHIQQYLYIYIVLLIYIYIVLLC